jgi:UDP-N-acetylglucosamine 2-epimerase (non-hydrolysing)
VAEKSIMIVEGTRPGAIKLAPVLWNIAKLGVEYIFVWSGQHYDYEMSKVFFDQLNLPRPDIFLNIGVTANDVSEQVSLLIQGIALQIKRFKPILVYSLGDTNTILAAALASAYTRTPFIHDEAGMRSFDPTMLEEINRKVADTVAYMRLTPTKFATVNLLYEGFSESTVWLTGSTAVDTLIYVLDNGMLQDKILDDLEVEPTRYILLTLHRRENLEEVKLRKAISILIGVAKRLHEFKVVFPIHPHTKKRLQDLGLLDTIKRLNNVILSNPLGYLEFITLLKNAHMVVTDSGGVQVEAFILGKRMVTLRPNTEWIETVLWGYNNLVPLDRPDEAVEIIMTLLRTSALSPPDLTNCPVGDGKAGMRVSKILEKFEEFSFNKQRINELKFTPLTDEKMLSYFSLPVRLQLAKGEISNNPVNNLSNLLKEHLKVDWNNINRQMLI